VLVVGGGGAVGEELLRLLAAWGQAADSITVLGRGDAPRAEAGSVVFLCTPPEVSRAWVRVLAGAAPDSRPFAVVDLSSALRRELPLVVPEVNGELLRESGAAGASPILVAGPNCTAVIAAMALAPLERAVGLESVVIVSLQAASGAGAAGIAALETELEIPGRKAPGSPFPATLARNVIPGVGEAAPDGEHGDSEEEEKLRWELRHLLGRPDMVLEVTTTRVPVERCHSLALHLVLNRALAPGEAREILRAAPGLVLDEDPHGPRPLECAGTDPVHVGRIRRGTAGPRSLSLFAVGDQLRKGAALNALQVAALLCRQNADAP
jgi:aspartate-semialdehyde dehydrogenase